VESLIETEDPGHAVNVHEEVFVVAEEVKDFLYAGHDKLDTLLTVKVPVQEE